MGRRALPDPKNLFATLLDEKCPAGFFKKRKRVHGKNEF